MVLIPITDDKMARRQRMHCCHDKWASWRVWNPITSGQKYVHTIRRLSHNNSISLRWYPSIMVAPRLHFCMKAATVGVGAEVGCRQSHAWFRILWFHISEKLYLFCLSLVNLLTFMWIYEVSYSKYKAQKEACVEIRWDAWCCCGVDHHEELVKSKEGDGLTGKRQFGKRSGKR